MWYRTKVNIPDNHGKLSFFFSEIDGTVTVYVNGEPLDEHLAKRIPFTVFIGNTMHSGDNVVALRVEHDETTDIFLGGILRPILLIEHAE